METPVRTNTKMPVILCSLDIEHWWNKHKRPSSQFYKALLCFSYGGQSKGHTHTLILPLTGWGIIPKLQFSEHFCVLCFYFTVDQPDPKELRLLSRSTWLALHLQRVNVGDGDHSGSNVPGQPDERAGSHQDTNPEQIQVVATAFLPGKPDTDHFLRPHEPSMISFYLKLMCYIFNVISK